MKEIAHHINLELARALQCLVKIHFACSADETTRPNASKYEYVVGNNA